MTNILRAASFAAVIISAAGTFIATDPGFASDASAQDVTPVLTIDPSLVDTALVSNVEQTGPAEGSETAKKSSATPEEASAIQAAIAAAEADAGKLNAKIEAASLADLVAKMPVPDTLDAETTCLAGTIYFESKGESLAGQLAVGRVVLNRAESPRFPNTICGVVYQRSQFSFVRGGRMPSINTGSIAWRRAVAIAQIARGDLWANPAKGALFFHASRVSPGWRLTRVAQVDNHIFYR